ncbi:hypothetical protein OFM36_33705, partial [Escherichia coli]|nr:hypothetical protein [Escherichia coli]
LPIGLGEPVEPDAVDLLYMGGGQDRDQRLCAEDLVATKAAGVRAAVEAGTPMLAVCGGYQLLGRSYAIGEEVLPGIGLAELRTERVDGP